VKLTEQWDIPGQEGEQRMSTGDTRKAALFVDFDNMFSGLRDDSIRAAERFANEPGRWLRWLEEGMRGIEGNGEPRRAVLVRRCYLNPIAFGRYRPFFTRAGFLVVDCPPLTAAGKNSADIVMVMDILDALEHRTRFDEFIVMSGDADFTPVFLRLRTHDRRTVAMVSTPVAAAYRSACDLLIPEELFVEQALGIDAEPTENAQPPLASPTLLARMAEQLAQTVRARGPVQATSLGQLYQEFPEFTRDSNWLGYFSLKALTTAIVATRRDLQVSDGPPWSVSLARATTREASPGTAGAPAAALADDGLKSRVVETLRALLRGSPGPVPMARAAQEVIRALGPAITETSWLGAGRFSTLLTQCVDLGLQVSIARSPGYLWDPARHEPPQVDTLGGLPEALASLVRRVHALTDAPGLAPDQYRALFDLIAQELEQHTYDLIGTGKSVLDRCASAGQPISRASINFVLRGVASGGYSLSDPTRGQAPEAMARAFHRNVEALIEQAQAKLTPDEKAMLDEWLLGEVPARVTEETGRAGAQGQSLA